MEPDPMTPIIIGVGDVKNKSKNIEDAIEPMQIMLQAIMRALEDSTTEKSVTEELKSNIDSLSVVATWTWPYADLPGLLAERLSIRPRHSIYSEQGGNQPIKLVDEAARRISRGESKIAVVTGGEALASLNACRAAKRMPPPGWTTVELGAKAAYPLQLSRLKESMGSTHSIGLPIHVYTLYENGFRAHRNQSIEQNNRESARMYADFAKIAEQNAFAWNYGQEAPSAEVIATVTEKNRMICFPYPLLMNAFNNVNLAASCVLTSVQYARHLGIPESKWIYPLGGAGTQDSDNFWERPNFHSSPAISRSLDACLDVSDLTGDDIDIFDFYSCFPIVPKLACQHMGLPFTNSARPITVLGGLTSFGGAGNNYSMHALTAMARKLRNGHHARNGLILANGGVLTYQHALCLSTNPRRNGPAYPNKNPLPSHVTDIPIPAVTAHAEGEAVVETYTIEYTRTGTPAKGFVIGRVLSSSSNDKDNNNTDKNNNKNYHRFVANAGDEKTLRELASWEGEVIGKRGWVWCESGSGNGDGSGRKNLFVFEKSEKREDEEGRERASASSRANL